MDAFIRCVKRPATNVFRTVAMACVQSPCFLQRVRLNLVSGDGGREFLGPFARSLGVELRYSGDDIYAQLKHWHPKARGAWSYRVALYFAKETGADALLMEDDLHFANGWFEYLMECVDEARAKVSGPWVLSAYFGFPATPDKPQGRIFEQPKGTQFYGNLCTFWPRDLISGAHAYFKSTMDRLPKKEEMHTDIMVMRYLQSLKGKVLYTYPSVVQHVGDVTTLRDDGIRRSKIFDDFYSK